MTRPARLLSLLVVAGAMAAPASANLITNPGFETGDFTGWTQSGNLGFTTVDPGNPHSGLYAAKLGPVTTDGFLAQTLVTVPSAVYNVSFWLFSDGFTPNNFSMSWGGSTSFTVVNLGSLSYTQFLFTLPATSASTEIKFGFRNDPGYLWLDDVEVVEAIPEPGTLLLLGSGLTGLALRRLRRQ